MGGLLVGALSGVTSVADARWSSIDLSYSSLPSLRLRRVTIDDCVFDGAECSDWRVWTSSIISSTFVGTNLRSSALGTWHEARGNAWEGVVFKSADLRSSFFTGARIVESEFLDSHLQDTSFRQVWMDRVKFSGLVQDVRFDGRQLPDGPPARTLTNVDFSKAVLRDVDFHGCRLENAQFAPGTLVVRNFPEVARRAIVMLSSDDSREARMFKAELDNAMKLPGSPDSVGIFTMSDYLADGGPPLADLVERTLARAQLGPH